MTGKEMYELKKMIVGELAKVMSIYLMKITDMYSEDPAKSEAAIENIVKNRLRYPEVNIDDLYSKAWTSYKMGVEQVNEAAAQLSEEGLISLGESIKISKGGEMRKKVYVMLNKYIDLYNNPKLQKYLLTKSQTD